MTRSNPHPMRRGRPAAGGDGSCPTSAPARAGWCRRPPAGRGGRRSRRRRRGGSSANDRAPPPPPSPAPRSRARADRTAPSDATAALPVPAPSHRVSSPGASSGSSQPMRRHLFENGVNTAYGSPSSLRHAAGRDRVRRADTLQVPVRLGERGLHGGVAALGRTGCSHGRRRRCRHRVRRRAPGSPRPDRRAGSRARRRRGRGASCRATTARRGGAARRGAPDAANVGSTTNTGTTSAPSAAAASSAGLSARRRSRRNHMIDREVTISECYPIAPASTPPSRTDRSIQAAARSTKQSTASSCSGQRVRGVRPG